MSNGRTCADAHWDQLILNVTNKDDSAGKSRSATAAGISVDSEILIEIPADASIMTSPMDDNVQYFKLTNLTLCFFGTVGDLTFWPT